MCVLLFFFSQCFNRCSMLSDVMALNIIYRCYTLIEAYFNVLNSKDLQIRSYQNKTNFIPKQAFRRT